MHTRAFPSTPDGRSPAGAEIRYLIEGETGNMIHSTVPPGQVNRATVHATVSEFWHVLSGQGQIWRRDDSGEETTVLEPGVSIDIPVGTAFQYRCNGIDPLQFLCISMPRWPGDTEATVWAVETNCSRRLTRHFRVWVISLSQRRLMARVRGLELTDPPAAALAASTIDQPPGAR